MVSFAAGACLCCHVVQVQAGAGKPDAVRRHYWLDPLRTLLTSIAFCSMLTLFLRCRARVLLAQVQASLVL
jgi:hypothetical protein